jgi:hypothetical protein
MISPLLFIVADEQLQTACPHCETDADGRLEVYMFRLGEASIVPVAVLVCGSCDKVAGVPTSSAAIIRDALASARG